MLQTAARGCALLPGPGGQGRQRETESGFQMAWSPRRAASQGAGPLWKRVLGREAHRLPWVPKVA